MEQLTPFSLNSTNLKLRLRDLRRSPFFDLLCHLTLSNNPSSPDAEANGEITGDRAPTNRQKAVKAAHVATQKAAGRLRKPPKNNGFWASIFASENQLWNILAMVVAVLLVLIFAILLASVCVGKIEFFLDASKPVLALIASTLAFIIGQRTGPSR